MNLPIIFKRLGYPKHTASVYTALTENKDPLLITEIAELCKISRVAVYRCLTELLKNGLAIKNEAGKRLVYSVGNIRLLRQAIKVANSEAETIAQQLMLAKGKDVPNYVNFMYGPAGIRKAFNDVISHSKKGDTFFRYTSEKDLSRVNGYLAPDYREKRDQKKLERKVISNAVSGKQKKSRLERFIRYIPAEADPFEQNIIQIIYGSRILFIDLNKEEVVLIENQQLADFQKIIFKTLYSKL